MQEHAIVVTIEGESNETNLIFLFMFEVAIAYNEKKKDVNVTHIDADDEKIICT